MTEKRGRVLIVDDEAAVRRLLERKLSSEEVRRWAGAQFAPVVVATFLKTPAAEAPRQGAEVS